MRIALLAAAALVSAAPAPVAAQAASFTLINRTNVDFSSIMVKRFGTQDWRPLAVVPIPVARSGGRGSVDFTNPDCAFDLQATLPDGRSVLWPGVNLCDAKVVTLNQGAGGELWVDYE